MFACFAGKAKARGGSGRGRMPSRSDSEPAQTHTPIDRLHSKAEVFLGGIPRERHAEAGQRRLNWQRSEAVRNAAPGAEAWGDIESSHDSDSNFLHASTSFTQSLDHQLAPARPARLRDADTYSSLTQGNTGCTWADLLCEDGASALRNEDPSRFDPRMLGPLVPSTWPGATRPNELQLAPVARDEERALVAATSREEGGLAAKGSRFADRYLANPSFNSQRGGWGARQPQRHSSLRQVARDASRTSKDAGGERGTCDGYRAVEHGARREDTTVPGDAAPEGGVFAAAAVCGRGSCPGGARPSALASGDFTSVREMKHAGSDELPPVDEHAVQPALAQNCA
ncbi:unnamed protein product [Pedinophyceae sp. YPF-701]|nr:unnamed protein product [Pedinophyceae sp. YPF-701]